MREWIFFTDLHTFKDRYELIQKDGLQGFCSWFSAKKTRPSDLPAASSLTRRAARQLH